jgi:hypothetical protein
MLILVNGWNPNIDSCFGGVSLMRPALVPFPNIDSCFGGVSLMRPALVPFPNIDSCFGGVSLMRPALVPFPNSLLCLWVYSNNLTNQQFKVVQLLSHVKSNLFP